MLCEAYGLDPLEDGVVICHSEGHKRGIASNHADVLHWFQSTIKTWTHSEPTSPHLWRESRRATTRRKNK
jgi:hypothetical protein